MRCNSAVSTEIWNELAGKVIEVLDSDNGYAVRMRALKDLATLAQSDTFSDVGWQDEGGYLSVNGYAAPAAEVFLAAEQNKNRVVIGGYASGCHAFVICLDNSVTETKGCFVFFMPETAISYYLTGFGTEEGYSYIIRKDGYVFSHVDQDYVGKLYFYENIYELDGGSSLRTLQMGDEKKIVNVGPMQRLNERYGGEYYLVSILDYGHYYGTFDLSACSSPSCAPKSSPSRSPNSTRTSRRPSARAGRGFGSRTRGTSCICWKRSTTR